MKYCYPEISRIFDTDEQSVNTIVIENPILFRKLVEDIREQIDGNDGLGILSDENQTVRMDKRAELLDHFIPFTLNSKVLLSKLATALEKYANEEDHYIMSSELLGQIERFIYEISSEFSGDIMVENLSVSSLIKACGVRFCDEYDSIAEKIVDYMELIGEYVGEKCFFIVNLRSYISDEEANQFMETIVRHRFHCIMLECCEKERVPWEKRLVIDVGLCEMG